MGIAHDCGVANGIISIITNNINHLGQPQNEKAIIFDGQSYKAPRVGLKPAT